MPISAKIRMMLDIAMAELTLVLMGENGLFYNACDGDAHCDDGNGQTLAFKRSAFTASLIAYLKSIPSNTILSTSR